jgi:hypothetical protein
MNFLPIAERELRVAARKRSTFWIRLFAAFITLLIAASLLLIFSSRATGFLPDKGKILFLVLSWMAFAYAFCAGVFLTADSLSEEKREGTLGLLFLTDLRGHDVVLGKLAATSLHAVYGLVAAFPILALSLLMGGLLAAEFWKGVVAILNMLFVSLAVGMLASTFARETLSAMNLAVLLLVALVGLPYLIDLSLAGWDSTKFVSRASLAATLHPYLAAIGVPRQPYWLSLAISHAAGWIFLALAAWRLPRRWQEERTNPSRINSRSDRMRANTDAALRSHDPILWLVSRSRRFRLWLLLVVLGAILIMSMAAGRSGVITSITHGVTNLLGLLLYFWMTAHATRFFVDGKRTGALELILCTPVTPRTITRAQWRSYVQAFWLPFLLLTGTEHMVLTMQWLNMPTPMTVYMIATQVQSVVTGISTAIAIGWFGMWMGLRSQKPHLAIIKTFVFVFVVPVIALGIAQTFLAFSIGFAAGFNTVFGQLLTPAITCSLWVGKDIGFILWSRRQLDHHFREAVAGLAMPRAPRKELAELQYVPPSMPTA